MAIGCSTQVRLITLPLTCTTFPCTPTMLGMKMSLLVMALVFLSLILAPLHLLHLIPPSLWIIFCVLHLLNKISYLFLSFVNKITPLLNFFLTIFLWRIWVRGHPWHEAGIGTTYMNGHPTLHLPTSHPLLPSPWHMPYAINVSTILLTPSNKSSLPTSTLLVLNIPNFGLTVILVLVIKIINYLFKFLH